MINFVDAIQKSAHSITGNVSCGTQYHFHMETQVCNYVHNVCILFILYIKTSQHKC